MSETESVTKLTIPASGDLSTKKYYAMTVNSSGQVATAGTAGVFCVGVLLNKPSAANQAAEVAVGGRTPAIAGAAFNAGVFLMTNSSGQLVTATSTNVILALALETASGANSIVDVLWNPRGVV